MHPPVGVPEANERDVPFVRTTRTYMRQGESVAVFVADPADLHVLATVSRYVAVSDITSGWQIDDVTGHLFAVPGAEPPSGGFAKGGLSVTLLQEGYRKIWAQYTCHKFYGTLPREAHKYCRNALERIQRQCAAHSTSIVVLLQEGCRKSGHTAVCERHLYIAGPFREHNRRPRSCRRVFHVVVHPRCLCSPRWGTVFTSSF